MFGHYGFGNAVPTEGVCPAGGEAWCYNPLVMHIQQNHPGVLSKGSALDIRDTFKRSLREAGYIPTSDLNVLVTPTANVMGALHYYQPDLAKALGSTLWDDAVAANQQAQLLAARIPIRLAPKAPPTIPIRFFPPTTAARGAVIAPPMEEVPKEIPWLWIGVGVVVVGGLVLFATRK